METSIQNTLTGMGVALDTPFKQDDSIDFDALGRLVDYKIQNKADYLVVLGTTAETPALTAEEKKDIVDFVKRRVNGQLPIVLGCGGNCTANVVKELQHADFSGIGNIDRQIMDEIFIKPIKNNDSSCMQRSRRCKCQLSYVGSSSLGPMFR